MTSWIRSHPAASYFTLAFTLSWGGVHRGRILRRARMDWLRDSKCAQTSQRGFNGSSLVSCRAPWHFLAVWWGSARSFGSVPVPLFLIVALFTFLRPYRVLMVRVDERTGSLRTLCSAPRIADARRFVVIRSHRVDARDWYLR
jgi:hypothetical protein